MVKTYLNFALSQTSGLIVSNNANITFAESQKIVFTACNEYLIAYDMKTGEQIEKICDQKIKISFLANTSSLIAVGYENGSIAMYEIANKTFSKQKYFNHKNAITCVSFDKKSTMMISSANDTNLIVYDLLAEIATMKLSGHKDSVIKCEFYNNDENFAISIGKDNTFKIWNLKNQICVFTHIDAVNKLTMYSVVDNLFLFAGFDSKIKIFEFKNDTKKDEVSLVAKGHFSRSSKAKIINIKINPNTNVIALVSADNSVEFFKILSHREIRGRLIKTMMNSDKNAKKEKMIQKDKFEEFKEKAKSLLNNSSYNYGAKFKSLFTFEETKQNSSKYKISDLLLSDNNEFIYSNNKNEIKIYTYHTDMLDGNIYKENKREFQIDEITTENDTLRVKAKYSISNAHREAVRYVRISKQQHQFITLSNESAILWLTANLSPIKTFAVKNATCALFINNDAYIAIATRSGSLILLNANSFEKVYENNAAHTSSIWSMTSYPLSRTKTRIITSGDDKSIKYFTITFDEELSVELYTEISIIDSVTYIALSPKRDYLIYSLMDNSIKIIYEDTQKFFLSLYGHKMPVTSFDISTDGMLLVSGAADKNVKIWGMDFGDCHKSFISHKDVVTCVKFLKQTHYVLSSSKDGTIIYYDADLFEIIMEISNEFFDTVWWLDCDNEGAMFIAVGGDFSVKKFEITEEQIVAKFAMDEKIEKLAENEMQNELDKKDAIINALNTEIGDLVPIKKRMDNIGYAEDLIDSLKMCDDYREEVYQYEIAVEEYEKAKSMVKSGNADKIKAYNLEAPTMPTASPKMLNMNIFDYMLWKIKMIRPSEIESTMNNISYTYFQSLLFYFEYFIRNGIEIELITRCVVFFAFLYHKQMSNDKTILRYLVSIKEHLTSRIKMSENLIAFNIKSIDVIIRSNTQKEKALADYESEEMHKSIFA